MDYRGPRIIAKLPDVAGKVSVMFQWVSFHFFLIVFGL